MAGGDRGQPAGGVPVPPAVPADVAGAAEPRALPLRRWSRAASSSSSLVAGVLGVFTGITAQAQWADLAAVAQRHPVRQSRTRSSSIDIAVLRVHLPVPAASCWACCSPRWCCSLLSALAVHYLFGGVRLQTPGEKVTPAARVHLSVLLGIFVLLKAVAYYLDRYGLLFNERDGLHRRGVHRRQRGAPGQDDPDVRRADLRGGGLRQHLPAQRAAAGDRAGAAGAHLGAGQRRSTRRSCSSSRSGRTRTRRKPSTSGATSRRPGRRTGSRRDEGGKVTTHAVRRDDRRRRRRCRRCAATRTTIPNARLLDPNVLSPDVPAAAADPQRLRLPEQAGHRPVHDRRRRPATTWWRSASSTRENLTGNQDNWINRHTVYTHGNGFVAARGERGPDRSEGDFEVRGLPTTGPIKVDQPRIYYGELITDYSIVGHDGERRVRPARRRDGRGQSASPTTATAASTSAAWSNRLAFAIVLPRAQHPALRRDQRRLEDPLHPRPGGPGGEGGAVPQGRRRPVPGGGRRPDPLDRRRLHHARTTTRTRSGSRSARSPPTRGPAQGTRALPREQVNYIRNSVKATVDAYTGKVDAVRVRRRATRC